MTAFSTPSPAAVTSARRDRVAAWPLAFLAFPAAVATWSGWVGIGAMTGFGIVHPLPGIDPSLRINTAITLPIGVEAYAACALKAWLTTTTLSRRTRAFARNSALASLGLGMAGQVTYHLLHQAHIARAPWPVTTLVACLPVLILGMGTALTHLLHADTESARSAEHTCASNPRQATNIVSAALLARAELAARELTAAGQHITRRNLRAAGLRGSNASLSALARALAPPAQSAPVTGTVRARAAGSDRGLLADGDGLRGLAGDA